MTLETAKVSSAQDLLPWEEAAEVEILAGDLQDVGLNSLVQLAQAESLTGWIRVFARGEVSLVKGRISGAVCGPLLGIEALRELMFLRDGRFSAVRGEPQASAPLEGVIYAIMDAYRLRDEWARLGELVLRRAGGQQWHPVGHPLDRVAQELDGRRTLAQVTAGLGAAVTVVLDALIDALNIGVLEQVAAPAPLAVVPTPAETEPELAPQDFHALLERGRELLREGDLDAAEAALRRALALRPDDRVASQNLRVLLRRRGERI